MANVSEFCLRWLKSHKPHWYPRVLRAFNAEASINKVVEDMRTHINEQFGEVGTLGFYTHLATWRKDEILDTLVEEIRE